MPAFSKKSQAALEGTHPDLKALFQKVAETYNCTILEGHRDRTQQDAAFRDGRSQVPWPHSKHNGFPSRAVDAAPWPLDWKNLKRFYHFAGFVAATAGFMGIKIRWGGDWNQDFEFDDNNFNDLVHFELGED